MTNVTTHGNLSAAPGVPVALPAAAGLPRRSPLLIAWHLRDLLDFFIVNVAPPSIQAMNPSATLPPLQAGNAASQDGCWC